MRLALGSLFVISVTAAPAAAQDIHVPKGDYAAPEASYSPYVDDHFPRSRDSAPRRGVGSGERR